MTISLPILGKFSTIISSSISSWPFFLSSSSGTHMIRMLGCLSLFQRSLRLSSFLLIFLFVVVVNVSWLGKLVSVFWSVELDLFSLECNEVSSNEF